MQVKIYLHRRAKKTQEISYKEFSQLLKAHFVNLNPIISELFDEKSRRSRVVFNDGSMIMIETKKDLETNCLVSVCKKSGKITTITDDQAMTLMLLKGFPEEKIGTMLAILCAAKDRAHVFLTDFIISYNKKCLKK